MLGDAVRKFAEALDDRQVPAYIYDLEALRNHAVRIRSALPDAVQFHYVAKANGDAEILRTLAPIVDSFEASSGGEIAHIVREAPDVPISFGAPGKTLQELSMALEAGVGRFHVESFQEIAALGWTAADRGITADVLIRVNLPGAFQSASLAMGGKPSPFGFDQQSVRAAILAAESERSLRLRGFHAHLASGLGVEASLETAAIVIAAARSLSEQFASDSQRPLEVNLGGGMDVDYTDPIHTFDWESYGAGLRELVTDNIQLRIEPGRSVSAYCGFYVTTVLDVRHSQGQPFVVVAGGTHHLRTPAAKVHSQPFEVLPADAWNHPWVRPTANGRVTVVGQLCTPKDILASDVHVGDLRAGDRIAFAMAGAYAWNISHHTFLMQPHPTFHYVDSVDGAVTK